MTYIKLSIWTLTLCTPIPIKYCLCSNMVTKHNMPKFLVIMLTRLKICSLVDYLQICFIAWLKNKRINLVSFRDSACEVEYTYASIYGIFFLLFCVLFSSGKYIDWTRFHMQLDQSVHVNQANQVYMLFSGGKYTYFPKQIIWKGIFFIESVSKPQTQS